MIIQLFPIILFRLSNKDLLQHLIYHLSLYCNKTSLVKESLHLMVSQFKILRNSLF